MAKVIVYTAVPCGYCKAAIRFLQEVKGVEGIEVVDLTGDNEARFKLVKETGQRTVPQIFINGTHIGGYDNLREKDARGEIDLLLAQQ
jgi:glutaredoxin 3